MAPLSSFATQILLRSMAVFPNSMSNRASQDYIVSLGACIRMMRKETREDDDTTTCAAQEDQFVWSCQGLFQPTIWSPSKHAPFLDVLADYLDQVIQSTPVIAQVAVPPAASPSLARSDDDTTSSQNRSAAEFCHRDHRLRELSCEGRTYPVDQELSPWTLEQSPIMACSLVPPDPTLATPPSATITSAGVAARKLAGRLSMFTGKSTPSFSLSSYISRLAQYTGCSAACFLYALSYMLRIDKQGHARVTVKTIHRMLLTAVVVAIKFIEDHCFINSHYAKVGGVELHELNHMELMMCSLLDFRFTMADGDPSVMLKQMSCVLGCE
eukprot:jgi/Ulvmu1/10557/UM065_0011.1